MFWLKQLWSFHDQIRGLKLKIYLQMLSLLVFVARAGDYLFSYICDNLFRLTVQVEDEHELAQISRPAWPVSGLVDLWSCGLGGHAEKDWFITWGWWVVDHPCFWYVWPIFRTECSSRFFGDGSFSKRDQDDDWKEDMIFCNSLVWASSVTSLTSLFRWVFLRNDILVFTFPSQLHLQVAEFSDIFIYCVAERQDVEILWEFVGHCLTNKRTQPCILCEIKVVTVVENGFSV